MNEVALMLRPGLVRSWSFLEEVKLNEDYSIFRYRPNRTDKPAGDQFGRH
jgi:hypothetical protein